MSERPTEVRLKRAPTLYAIVLFKLVKGVLFLFFGLVLYFQAERDLPQEYADLLKKPIFQNLRIHPENKLVQHIAEQIADVTPKRIRWTAVGTMLWSLFPLTEGIGLLFRASWAGWLAIGESAFFVPIEFYDLAKQFNWYWWCSLSPTSSSFGIFTPIASNCSATIIAPIVVTTRVF